MNHTFTRKNKKLKSLLAILTGVVLLLGSTYAWRDLSQHKTNPWGDLRDENTRNVTLNDEFTPPEKLMSENKPVPKIVSVSNLEDSGGDVCVRLAVREFMQLRISDTGAYYTEIKDGKEVPILFATFANNNYAAKGYPQGSYIPFSLLSSTDPFFKTLADLKFLYGESDKIPTGVDAEGAETFETYATTTIKEIRNGIYGKTMPVVGDVLQKWGRAVFAQPTHRARPDVPSGECNYNPYLWDGKGIEPTITGAGIPTTTNDMRDFVTLTGATPITMAAFSATAGNNSKLGNFWVYDTDGYVYWGNRLKQGENTTNLLESAQFKKDPTTHTGTANGNNNTNNNANKYPVKLDYFMHIDMDACDETEKEIVNVFANPDKDLLKDVEEGTGPGQITDNKRAFLQALINGPPAQ